MSSMIFSDDEARFLRLVLRLAEKPPDDNKASWMTKGLRMTEKKAKSAGEFRVLVIGDRGVGKTSLLTKFCTGAFPDASTISSSSFLHGCRHTVSIEESLYTMDALELPVDHLSSPDHLTQALTITDAAVLVYDITSLASLTYLKSLSGTLHDALHAKATAPTKKRTNAFSFHSSPSSREDALARESRVARPYHFLLLGAKNDAPPGAREVSWLEGQNAAGEFFGPGGVAGGASASFMEVSARSGENVGAVFPSLGREVLRSRRGRREEEVALQQRQLQRRGAEGGASGGGWEEYSGFGYCFGGDDDDDNDGDGDTDECDCADGGTTLRRRWCALKATLSGSIFRKESGK